MERAARLRRVFHSEKMTMSDIDLAVRRSKRLEQMLERDFGASGRGLQEKVSSVEQQLPPETSCARCGRWRRSATRSCTTRATSGWTIARRFKRTCDDAERELRALRGGRRVGMLVWVIVLGIVVDRAGGLWAIERAEFD
jgi:hypothetical protein